MYDKHKVTIDLEELNELQRAVKGLSELSEVAVCRDALLMLFTNMPAVEINFHIKLLKEKGIEVKIHISPTTGINYREHNFSYDIITVKRIN